MIKKNLFPALLVSLAFSGIAYAHNPRIVESGTATNIENPEISQVFYGTLSGKPQLYFIDSVEPFELYTGLLAPDVPEARKNFSAEVIQVGKYVDGDGKEASGEMATSFTKKVTPLLTLDGTQTEWEHYYEEFGGDWYWKGPETAPMDVVAAPSPAGLYEIKVSNPGNTGKYALVVGKKEAWGPREIWGALVTMPRQKIFFEKSPFSAFSNRIGLFLLGPIIGLIALVFIVWLFVKKNNKEKVGMARFKDWLSRLFTKRWFQRK